MIIRRVVGEQPTGHCKIIGLDWLVSSKSQPTTMAAKEILNLEVRDGICAIGTTSYMTRDGESGFADVWRSATTQDLLKFTFKSTAKDWTLQVGKKEHKRTTTVQTPLSTFVRVNISDVGVYVRLSPDGEYTEIGELGSDWTKAAFTRPLPQLVGSQMTVGNDNWTMTGDKLPAEAVSYLTNWFGAKKKGNKRPRTAPAPMTDDEIINFLTEKSTGKDTQKDELIVSLQQQKKDLDAENVKLQNRLSDIKTELDKQMAYWCRVRSLTQEWKKKETPKKAKKVGANPTPPPVKTQTEVEQPDLSLDPPSGINFDALTDGIESTGIPLSPNQPFN